VEGYLQELDFSPLTPEIVGTAIVGLVREDTANVAPTYVLTGARLQKLP
jgi:hypothetical protein